MFRNYIPEFRFPKKIKKIFLDIYSGQYSRVIIKGPRGGGKSKLLSAVAFRLWFSKHRDIVDMGGVYAQAKIVYNYITEYIESDEKFLSILDKPPLMHSTKDKNGKYIKCVPTSPKQVRGPHPDVLLGDEIVEAKDEIVESAFPMVDTSDNPLIVLASTFHKIFGVFQEVWDNAEAKGYKRYSWDIFDIAKRFDTKVWDDVKLNREIIDFKKLKELSKGKTGDKEGWVRIENIIQAWREKPDLNHFLVEYMGSRPSQAGLITNPEDIDACTFDSRIKKSYDYIKDAYCSLGIDWGFSSMTSIVDLMKYKDQKKVLLENLNYTQVPLNVIIEDVIEILKIRPRQFIYADSSGKFENVALQQAINKAYRLKTIECNTVVKEVVFSKEKEKLLGTYRSHWERRLLLIPKKFKVAIWQYKRYRYQEGTDKPVKKDDHIPDATLCALMPFKLRVEIPAIKSYRKTEEIDKPITRGILTEEF